MGRAVCKTELYQQRRRDGLCVQCGADAGGKSRCTSCAAKSEAARKQRRAKRKVAGGCTACNRPAKEGRALCQDCIDARSKVSTERYYRNKAADVCRLCGGETDGTALCEKCRTTQKKHARAWYHRQLQSNCCVRCGEPHEQAGSRCSRCREDVNQSERQRYARLREEVLKAYGGLKCVHCGTTDPDVLQIDHINGGGTQHLKEIGYKIYAWLRKQGFPPGYQVLYANCDTKKARDANRMALSVEP